MTGVPPILEFDPDRSALIDPFDRPPIPGTPRAAVACFFLDLVERLGAGGEIPFSLPSLGKLWKIDFDGSELAVFYPGQGASLAAVTLERVLGARVVIVACGEQERWSETSHSAT